jgi:hypothetical protein
VTEQLIPLLRERGAGNAADADEVHAQLCRALDGVIDRLLDWSPAERRFLDMLHDDGVVAAEALHADPAVQERIRSQPMLQWKAQNVREHRQRM